MREILEKIFQRLRGWSATGGRLHAAAPLVEAIESFLLTPGETAAAAPFVRDAVDLKRVMVLVVVAVLPCFFIGTYNVGHQALLSQGLSGSISQEWWLGLKTVMPLLLVVYTVGGFWEVLFAVVRRREITEGFLVTGILFTLTLPPTMPLWQAAVSISFGVVIGKEIFGGTGFNLVNPALAARAFAFFAYPAQMSGDAVWVAVDGLTKATPLAVVAQAPSGAVAIDALAQAGYSFSNMMWGFVPGSIGETSAVACVIGLVVLLATGVANWRIVAGCCLGMTATVAFVMLGQAVPAPAITTLPFSWHFVMGGFAFGAVFMATDPVSSSATEAGRWIYGALIGAMVAVIRIFNPAYPEGVMLAILLMNIFAPLIDHGVLEVQIIQRRRRNDRARRQWRRNGEDHG